MKKIIKLLSDILYLTLIVLPLCFFTAVATATKAFFKVVTTTNFAALSKQLKQQEPALDRSRIYEELIIGLLMEISENTNPKSHE